MVFSWHHHNDWARAGADTSRHCSTIGVSPTNHDAPQAGERPPSGMLSGYTQTYLIWKTAEGAEASMVDGDGKEADDQTEHEILFRCGNWCYTGHVVLRSDLGLEDMPVAIPLLQRQQSRLHYYCNAGAIPQQSNFHQPIKLVYAASDFAAQCFSSGVVTSELARLADVYSWVEEDSRNTFFEMKVDPPSYMDNISLVCSKTYARGLIFIAVYCEGSFYFTVSDGEGDQPLLDVKFPDVSHHGQGVALLSQQAEVLEGLPLPPWFISLSLWHSLPSELKICPPPTRNLSTTEYIQVRRKTPLRTLAHKRTNCLFVLPSSDRSPLFCFFSFFPALLPRTLPDVLHHAAAGGERRVRSHVGVPRGALPVRELVLRGKRAVDAHHQPERHTARHSRAAHAAKPLGVRIQRGPGARH